MFKLRRSKKFEDIEPHEILLDSLAQKKATESDFADKKMEIPLFRLLFHGFFLFCMFVLSALFLKTLQLQIIEGKEYSRMARENKFIVQQLEAERGIIYDKNLEQLVFNRSSFDLVCQKSALPDPQEERAGVLAEIASIVGEDVLALEEAIESAGTSQVMIAGDLGHQTLILLEAKAKDLPGFLIKNNTVREYISGETFSHLIGYTGRINSEEYKEEPEVYSINDSVGRAGLENSYEDVLRKNPGQLRIERDALGNVISKEIISEPDSGKSLVLSVDAGLQEKIKTELQDTIASIGSKKAVGIALDPKTGQVLALVSLPGFDNNLFQKGADTESLLKLLSDKDGLEPLFNRAISGRYLTGSTIKPLIASAALEEKTITPEKKISCQGQIVVPHQYDPEIEYRFTDMHVHGWTDMKKAIAESCNVYFFTIGGGYGDQEGLGPTRIKQYLELFGWGKKTGIDLPGEKAGFLPDKEWKKETLKEGWWDGDTYNMSIGQGYLLITPLEVAAAFAAIANGGTLYRPEVVQRVVEGSADSLKTIEEFQPEIIRENFISPENLQTVREGMRQTVTAQNSPQATAYDLNFLPVSSAAKTGTAETYRENYYHNWINVFAPYENPEIVLTILIEDVKGVQRVVTPLAYNILNWYFSRDNELESK